MFDPRADLTRLQSAASAFQHDNPHFNQLLDVASGLLYGSGASQLNPADKRGLSMILATAQNSIPGMGNPVADFTAMNRALISGALPVMSVAADGSRSMSNSYGTGNVSLTATAQLMRNFENSMRTSTGSVDLGQTRGLSQNLRADLLTHLVSQRGIKSGEIITYDLGKATNAASIDESLKKMREDGIETGTLKNLEKVRDAMSFAQKKLGVSDLADVEAGDISNVLSEHFDESTIKMTLAQARGKNTNFQTQTKKLNDELKEMYKDVADNVKELSHLFETEDLDKLENFAKGAGISNFLDKSKAHEVRAQMRDIAITAEMTGRSPQEVAAERVSIATGMSAMYGGRAVTGNLINVVQSAGLAATTSKGDNLFTKEESMAAAARSIANMQNVYGGAIVATSLYKELEKRGGVTEEMRAEFSALKSAYDNATDDKEKRRLSMKMENWSRASWGSEVVDSPEVRAHAFAKYSGEFHADYVESIKKTNARRHINNVGDKHGLSEEGKETMVRVGEKLMSTFGNNQQARDEFFRLIETGNSGDTNKAVEMLRQGGMTEDEAKQFIKDTNSVGKSKAATIWNPLLTGAQFMQQISGSYDDGERRKLLVTKVLNGENLIKYEDDDAIRGFLSGLIGEGGITTEGAAEATLAEALRVSSKGSSQEEKNAIYQDILKSRGMEAINIGAADENGKFTIKDPAQKRAVMDKLGIKDEKEFDKLLADAPAYIKKVEEAGFNVSEKNRDSINGGMLAYSRKDAESVRDNMLKSIGDQGEIAAAQRVWGSDNVSFELDENKQYVTKVKVGSEMVSLKDARAKADAGTLKRLADQGDKEAEKALSDKFKNVIDKKSRETLKSTSAVARLSDKQDSVNAEQFSAAVREDYGTKNTDVIVNGTIDDWVREGIAQQYVKNGKVQYRMLHSLKGAGKAGEFTEGATITEEQIKALQSDSNSAFMKQARKVNDLVNGVGGGGSLDLSENSAPTVDQMSQAIKLLGQIVTNTMNN